MKTRGGTKCLCSAVVAFTMIWSGRLSAGQTNAAPERIGIYDSRVIAYAHFWGDDYQRQLTEQTRAAKAAKAAGDTVQFEKLSKALANEQQKIHQQVFSTAPAIEALAALQKRLPEIQKQAGVSVLISKWDDPALNQHKSAVQVDLTDALVKEFAPAGKHLKVIESIRSKPPLPLEQSAKAD